MGWFWCEHCNKAVFCFVILCSNVTSRCSADDLIMKTHHSINNDNWPKFQVWRSCFWDYLQYVQYSTVQYSTACTVCTSMTQLWGTQGRILLLSFDCELIKCCLIVFCDCNFDCIKKLLIQKNCYVFTQWTSRVRRKINAINILSLDHWMKF